MAEDRHKSDAASRKGQKNEYIENHDENEYSEEEEPDFSDAEDFVDNISDEELLGDLLEKRPSEKDGIDSVIVVDNVPKVQTDNERFNKLKNVIKKIFSSFGKIVNEFYPTLDDGQTKGYIFIEYTSPQHAHEASLKANNYKLDKNHTLLVNLFSDFDKFDGTSKNNEDPQIQPYTDLGNMRSWCMDEDASDQYAIITDEGIRTAIYKNRPISSKLVEERTYFVSSYLGNLATFHYPLPKAKGYNQMDGDCHPLVTDGQLPSDFPRQGGGSGMVQTSNPSPKQTISYHQRWTETVIRWSPMGSYLATFHQKGVALWGGPEFKQIMRFLHPGVQVLDFSPCERYLVTFCSEDNRRDDQQSIMIWDILTGQKKRGFNIENRGTWPIIKWSSTGQYFAKLGTDCISVYEVPSFGLLDKKSIKIDGVKEFCWSPANKIISYWVPERENVPCRVTLIEIPSRKDLCVKNLFNVADCKMHWQRNGDFMCVKVDRYSKVKEVKEEKKYSGIYCNFELFRIREKQIPIDKVECKEPVIAFAWEPNGNRFAFLHGESSRISLSFYAMKSEKVELLKMFEKRMANMLFWSPNGQFIVAAGLRSMNGTLEFIDTSDMTVMQTTEHFMATDIEWDPSGRYVCTFVSWWGHKVDNAYWIHNFQGRSLQKNPIEKFCHFSWRPRPPSLLKASHLQEVKKNFKKYAQQFEIKDKISQSTASKELMDRRRELMQAYNKYRQMKMDQHVTYKQQRLDLRDGTDTDELDSHMENMDNVVEFLVESKETPVDNTE